MSFRTQYSTPTEQQYALLGRVVAEWALAENLLGTALGRLVMTADFPALALTSQMDFNRGMKALKALLDLHEHRYHYRFIDVGAVASGKAIVKQLDKLQSRAERNRVAHAVWIRSDDDNLFAYEAQAFHPTPENNGKSLPISNDHLEALAEQIVSAIESLEAFVSLLPEKDELPPQA